MHKSLKAISGDTVSFRIGKEEDAPIDETLKL
jgi:hypothetical protein